MEQSWLAAAQAYLRMDEPARAAYWSALSPEQRLVLTQTVETGRANHGQQVAPAKFGCMRTVTIGCAGMILGCILTIAGEIWAFKAGVDFVEQAFRDAGVGTAGSVNDPVDPMPEFCRDGMVYADPNERVACVQWAERHRK